MRTRSLNLNKETLTELSVAELDSVAGASGVPCGGVTGQCVPETALNCITGLQCVLNMTHAC